MIHPDYLGLLLTPRQLMDWRQRLVRLGSQRADQRALLSVGASLAPWSKEIKISQMVKEFTGDGEELISDNEWAEIKAAARKTNADRFKDGYPDWHPEAKKQRTL